MPLRAARTPPTDPARLPLRSLGSSRARRTVVVLVGSVVVGTGLGAAGIGLPSAGVEQAEASGTEADLLGAAPDGAASTSSALDARAAAEVSSRSAVRDAAVDAEQLRRAEQGSDAAREGALATRAASAAEVVAQQQAEQAAQAAAEAAAQQAAEQAAAAEAERQRAAAAEQAAEQAAVAAAADPRAIGRSMAAQRGWGADQFTCLDSLWTKESGWTATADNPTSDAYGIPQSLPGEKMAAAGADWATNPATQISWGLTYIGDVYGTPCSAWAHSRATNWY